MQTHAVWERPPQDVSLWLTDGVVSPQTHNLCFAKSMRQETPGWPRPSSHRVSRVVLVTLFGLLGMVAVISNSKVWSALLLFAAGMSLMATGIRLSLGKLSSYANSCNVILTFGLLRATLGVGVAIDVRELTRITYGFSPESPFCFRSESWPVAIKILSCQSSVFWVFFHWVGTWNRMFRRPTYALFIEDPRLMSTSAFRAVILGIYHVTIPVNSNWTLLSSVRDGWSHLPQSSTADPDHLMVTTIVGRALLDWCVGRGLSLPKVTVSG
jgi:hypothetical protein